jgi:hypothetical protein
MAVAVKKGTLFDGSGSKREPCLMAVVAYVFLEVGGRVRWKCQGLCPGPSCQRECQTKYDLSMQRPGILYIL